MGARTKRIEIGTAVIDMRYENPFYMAEDAGAADLIAGGLQLGISRGSPEQVIDGYRHFGYEPAEGETDADMGGSVGGQTPTRTSSMCGATSGQAAASCSVMPTSQPSGSSHQSGLDWMYVPMGQTPSSGTL